MARNSFVLNATSLSKARSSWIMPKTHKCSIPFGKLCPVGKPIEILPGDTFGLDMGAVIRMLTPKAPLMDSITGDVYAYFVPDRLVFDKTKEFFGQNESQAWTLNLNYTIPQLKFTLSSGQYSSNNSDYSAYGLTAYSGQNLVGSLLDHFELPFINITSTQRSTFPSSPTIPNVSLNALPFRGYQIIWNEDFRNPAVVDPELAFNYDHSDVTIDTTWFAAHGNAFKLKPVMRYRDLFSSALKAPMRGPSVTLPLGTSAPIYTTSTQTVTGTVDVTTPIELHPKTQLSNSSRTAQINTFVGDDDPLTVYNGFLYADLSSASAATINTIRQSIALQHLYEMMTNAFRYNEYTEVFFGVRGSDATLQRPQHLGGIHFRVNVNQVVSTADTSSGSLGQTGAFGTAEIKGHVYTNSFTEHGYIFLLVCLRKEHTYVQGLDKDWRKKDFLDIFQPPLAHIGNVDIKNSEVYFAFDSNWVLDDGAFGYTEPYYEYRYAISKACGLMNPLASGSLSFYSLTDVLASKPYLNQSFVAEDPNGLDNALIASASNVDQFFGDFYLRYKVSRVMPLYCVPGLNRI